MKRLITLLFCGFFFQTGFSQLIQASLGQGTDSNRVKIYLKPSVGQAPANISTLQFNIGIDTSVSPKPTMTIVSTTMAGVNWSVTESTEGGYNNYQITTASSPLQPTTVANTEFEVMEVMFSNGPVTAKNVSLITLPDGGIGTSSGNSIFLCTGSYTSDGSSLYYTRPGVSVVNTFSYDASGTLSGVATSSATISGIILPVTWLNFSARQQSTDAVLQWNIANNDLNYSFEIERSINGREFIPIKNIKTNTSIQQKGYTYIDEKITDLKSTILFYRIKQKDINGKVSYSDTRSLKLNSKVQIVVYPNPAKEGFSFKLLSGNISKSPLILKLRNSLSQIEDVQSITGNQAVNYYYALNKVQQSGRYTLEIYNDEILIDTKSIIIHR